MAAEVHRAIGGAGTGKTRLILDRLSEARDDLGLSTDEIGFCTFTRAGRAEIAERAADAWGVSPDDLTRGGWFKTAHAIAHRCCRVEEGQLLQGMEGDEWLSGVLGGKVHTRTDSRGERTYVADGDDSIPLAMKAWELARSRMESLEATIRRWATMGENCPEQEQAASIIRRYELAKTREGRLDFTDMIARFAGVKFTLEGPVNIDPVGDAPEHLRVLAVDEAQDSSQLVDRVCRRLASSGRIERVWLCGDPYQSIHSFAGGDYNLFLAWKAEEYTMPQSYRCPGEILALGERCLRQMQRGYRDRGILPAAPGGRLSRVASADEALARINANSSALILGRCTFSLEDYEAILKARRLPYQWVDKAHAHVQLSGYGSLWALQHGRSCLGESLANAVGMISVKSKHGSLLKRGAKAEWKDGRKSHLDIVRPTDGDCELAGFEQPLRDLIRSGRWVEALEPRYQERASLWHEVATRHGEELANNPPIRLSTIHSAKGLEADDVILSSITSPSIERGRETLSEIHDEECRVAYVAVTRAKRSVTFVEDGFRCRMELPL
jgi:DNA helicase-2/ATP-dependent DNA helicase PcrA